MRYLRSRPLLAFPECVKPRNSLVTCDLTVLVLSRVTFAFLCPTVATALPPTHGKVCSLRNLEHGKVCSKRLTCRQVTHFERSDWLEVTWLALSLFRKVTLTQTHTHTHVYTNLCPPVWIRKLYMHAVY